VPASFVGINIAYFYIDMDKTIRIINKNSVLLLAFCCLFAASVAYSGSIVNSRHDLHYAVSTYTFSGDMRLTDYGEVCVYCHTPHGANSGIDVPLWNRNIPTQPYTLYNSTTMDNPPTSVSGISLGCLSCHDGTIATDEIINAPGSGTNTYDLGGTQYYYGVPETQQHYKMDRYDYYDTQRCGICHPGYPTAHDATASYLTTDLTDDHPISMDYPLTSDFNAPPDSQKGWPGDDIKLFAGKVECASCHDVHDPGTVSAGTKPFLRISNNGSALCKKCHIK